MELWATWNIQLALVEATSLELGANLLGLRNGTQLKRSYIDNSKVYIPGSSLDVI